MFDVMDVDPLVRIALERAGWFPGRCIDVAPIADPLREWGVPMPRIAHSILEPLGGLTVEPLVVEGADYFVDRFKFSPSSAAEKDVPAELRSAFGRDFYPIALMYTDEICVADDGLTVCTTQYEHLILGGDFGAALSKLICAEGSVERLSRS